MYSPHIRREAVSLLDSGLSYTAVSQRLGVSRSSLREWSQHRALVDKYMDSDLCGRCKPLPSRQNPNPRTAISWGSTWGWLHFADG